MSRQGQLRLYNVMWCDRPKIPLNVRKTCFYFLRYGYTPHGIKFKLFLKMFVQKHLKQDCIFKNLAHVFLMSFFLIFHWLIAIQPAKVNNVILY